MAGCLVVTYHYIRDAKSSNFPHLKALLVDAFRTQLEGLCHRYVPIDYRTFHRALIGEIEMSEPSVLLTFDDGLIEHHETVFPILNDRNLPAVFFVPTSCFVQPKMLNVHRVHFLLAHLGADRLREEIAARLGEVLLNRTLDVRLATSLYQRDIPPDAAVKQLLHFELPYDIVDPLLARLFEHYFDDEQDFARDLYCSLPMLKEMSRAGMTLGAHTWHHRVLSRLSVEEQRLEVADAPEFIRKLSGQNEIPFCYPFGLPATYGVETLPILEAAGYASAFTVIAKPVEFKKVNLFELPRTDTNDVDTLEASETKKNSHLNGVREHSRC